MKTIAAGMALAVCTAACATACATTGSAPGRGEVGDAIRARTGRELRSEPATTPSLPSGISLGALTREDAVAIALWNSPSFEASLTDLGLARADLVEARLLRTRYFRCCSRGAPNSSNGRCSSRWMSCGSARVVSPPPR